MADAERDSNYVPSLLAVSNVDGFTPVTLYADPTTHRLLVSSTGSGTPTTITVANEATDADSFPLFVTAATGDLGPKTNAGLTFNSSTGALASTLFSAGTITANTAFVPDASDGAALGTTALQFSDVFLAEGGVINWDNGDVTITQTGDILAIAGVTGVTSTSARGTLKLEDITGSANSDAGFSLYGGAAYPAAVFTEVDGQIATFGVNVTQIGSRTDAIDGYIFRLDTRVANTGFYVIEQVAGGGGAETALVRIYSGQAMFNENVVPYTSNAAQLGTATLMWSDLFLASGAVVNFNNGDVTLTHGANVLTLGGGDLALGANNLTMTGSLATTGARVTKGWFTDLEVTNAIAGSVTGNAATVTGFTPASGSLTLAGADALTLTTSAGSNVTLPTTGTLATLAGTETLSSKRINPRVVTTTDDATAVIDVDVTDQYQLTAVANATTFSTTGTPVAGQKLTIRFKDAGVAKGLTWDAVFRAIGVTLPTTTVVSKTHYVGCIYNATDSKWDAVAALQEA